MSEETKNKIRIANTGKRCPEERRIRISIAKTLNPTKYWLGKNRPSLSEETKRRMSESQKRIGNKPPVCMGEANNKWRGGVSLNIRYKHYKNKEYISWRKSVFERDNYTCQMCLKRSGTGESVFLHPHHKLSYTFFPEHRYDVNNGITLCIKCHRLIHSTKKGQNGGDLSQAEFIPALSLVL